MKDIANSGSGLGYGAARLFTKDTSDCHTLAIEVGMQNSGLAATLAGSCFSSAAALPAALFSLWHNLSGDGPASFFGTKKEESKN